MMGKRLESETPRDERWGRLEASLWDIAEGVLSGTGHEDTVTLCTAKPLGQYRIGMPWVSNLGSWDRSGAHSQRRRKYEL